MTFLQKFICLFALFLLFSFAACQTSFQSTAQSRETIFAKSVEKPSPAAAATSDEIKKLLESAIEQTTVTKSYDPAYVVAWDLDGKGMTHRADFKFIQRDDKTPFDRS